jgi:hypothetical protein
MFAEQDQRRRGDRPDRDQRYERDLGLKALACNKRQRNKGRAGDRGQHADKGAEPADIGGDPVSGKSHRGIGDREDRQIHHQEQDDGAWLGAMPTSAASFGRKITWVVQPSANTSCRNER